MASQKVHPLESAICSDLEIGASKVPSPAQKTKKQQPGVEQQVGDERTKKLVEDFDRVGSPVAQPEEVADFLSKKDDGVKEGLSWVLTSKDAFVRYWDGLTTILLVFTAIVTPFEVAYLETSLDALFFINRLVDLCFLCDLFLQFFMGYFDEDLDQWVLDLSKIRRKYLSTWFSIDIVSIFPFDVIGVVANSEQVQRMKILRIVRLARLAKLLRILRAGRIFQRYENRISINYSTLQLYKFLFTVIIVAHWMACGFYMVVSIEGTDLPEATSWINDYNSNDGVNVKWPIQMYLVGIYWAFMTMSTIGYGDVLPRTDAERVYTVCAMIIGASIYAYIVGSVCGIVASMDADRTAFYHMMDGLNIFMAEKRLPSDLRMRLREYFRYRRHNRSIQDRQNLLQEMSVTLREEVAAHTHGDWMKTVPIFKGAVSDFIVSTTLLLKHQTFSPREAVYRPGDLADRMFIVERGVVASKGRIYTSPKVFGDDGLLRRGGKRTAMAITLSYCVTYVLEQQALVEALNAFPQEARKFRTAVAKTQVLDGLALFKEACTRRAAAQGLDSIHKLFIGRPGPQVLVLLNSSLLQGICSANSNEDYDTIVDFMLRIFNFGENNLRTAVTTLQKVFRGWRERRELVRLNPMLMFNLTNNVDSVNMGHRKSSKKPRSVENQLIALENMCQSMHQDMLLHLSAISTRLNQVQKT